jgi:transcriptional regulator of arginine metabolism
MTARDNRHNNILRLIAEKEIDTQTELVESLINLGFDVTQATVSRDIKELGLIKIRGEKKKYKYAVQKVDQGLSKLANLFRESVISIDTAVNQIVIKTFSGSANTAAVFLDKIDIKQIIGTLAGDDAILVIVKTIEDVPLVYNILKEYTKR